MTPGPQTPVTPVPQDPLELIAASIGKVADGLDKLRKSGLTPRAAALLIKDVTGVPLSHIEQVISAGPRLRKMMLEGSK